MKPFTLYRIFDVAGALLWVGQTTRPFERMREHSGDKLWVREMYNTRHEFFPDRDTLLIAEALAIRTEHPKYNVVFNAVADRPTRKARVRWTASDYSKAQIEAAQREAAAIIEAAQRKAAMPAVPVVPAVLNQTILIKSAQLRARLGGISDMTLWRWVRKEINPLPQPIKIGDGSVNFWRVKEIETWLAAARSENPDNHARENRRRQ